MTTSKALFRDRSETGMRLATAVKDLAGDDLVVLGIPRGGVVVAEVVARELHAPLDVVVTRKIGAPGEPEYAIGAVTQEGEAIVDRQAAESLGATPEYIEAQIGAKRAEVAEMTRRLRGDAPFPSLQGKVVLLVDDGIATGSSVGAAVLSVKRRKPKQVVIAVPVAPRGALETLSEDGTKVVALQTPASFLSIGQFYADFGQVQDEDVKAILRRHGKSASPPPKT